MTTGYGPRPNYCQRQLDRPTDSYGRRRVASKTELAREVAHGYCEPSVYGHPYWVLTLNAGDCGGGALVVCRQGGQLWTLTPEQWADYAWRIDHPQVSV